MAKRYWQIPVAPEDVYKTAFVTPDGQYEFLRANFLGANRMEFLGHQIGGDVITPSQDNLDKVQKLHN